MRACVLYVPSCLRAMRAYVPSCFGVPSCLRAFVLWRANVPACQRAMACLSASVPTCHWNFYVLACHPIFDVPSKFRRAIQFSTCHSNPSVPAKFWRAIQITACHLKFIVQPEFRRTISLFWNFEYFIVLWGLVLWEILSRNWMEIFFKSSKRGNPIAGWRGLEYVLLEALK